MNAVNEYDLTLENLYEQSVGKLLMTGSFDEKAFGLLYKHLERKAKLLQSEYMVSKQIVSTILKTSAAIRNTAEHVQLSKNNLELASKFDFLLSLIAINETPASRQPNVPRIQ